MNSQPTIAQTLRIRLLDERAVHPRYATAGAAGLDLSACLPRGEFPNDAVTMQPGDIIKLPTGLAIAIPEGHEGQVRARSGLATRHGIGLPNAPGTIDCDYRGELLVALINLGRKPHTISNGDRIAQLVIAPVTRVEITEVETLEDTERGAGGFGSTGFSG